MTVLCFLLHWNSFQIQVLLFVHGDAKLTVWLLRSVCRPMLINYCMTLHEIVCMFLVTDRPQTYLLFTISKDHNSTSTHPRVTFLALCVPSQKKVREKSRECHNHKPQPFPDPKRRRKPTNPNKHKSNKRTKSTKISSLFPKRGNRNTKRTDFHRGLILWFFYNSVFC